MTITESLITFTFAVTLLTLTPGIDTALILRAATVESKKEAFHAAFGINAGCFAWGLMVAFGLGAFLMVSTWAYDVVKWCGAAYLCWLGMNMLLHPRKQISNKEQTKNTHQNWLIKGFLGNLLNPKVGIFYISFLPQFIPAGQPAVLWTLGLVSIHVVLIMIWSTFLILVTQPMAHFFKNEQVIRWMDRTTGFVLLLFAVKLAVSKRT